jgi:hypothetical protein
MRGGKNGASGAISFWTFPTRRLERLTKVKPSGPTSSLWESPHRFLPLWVKPGAIARAEGTALTAAPAELGAVNAEEFFLLFSRFLDLYSIFEDNFWNSKAKLL